MHRLEAAVQRADDAPHDFGAPRDLAGPRLPRGALGLDRAAHWVKLDLARVPERHEDLRVDALSVGADEREREGARGAGVLADEGVAVERTPFAFSLQRRLDERHHRRWWPARFRIRRVVGRRGVKLAELFGHGIGAVVAGNAAHDLIELIACFESDGLDDLHVAVAEPRDTAHAVDGPGDEIAGSRLARRLLDDETRAVVVRRAFGVERDVRTVGVAIDEERLFREPDHDALCGRLELEESTTDARELPCFLEIGQRALQALGQSPLGALGLGLAREVDELHHRRDVILRDRPGGATVANDETVLVGGGGLAQVVEAR